MTHRKKRKKKKKNLTGYKPCSILKPEKDIVTHTGNWNTLMCKFFQLSISFNAYMNEPSNVHIFLQGIYALYRNTNLHD